MSNFLYYLAAFAVVLGVLIVVHEYGHYRVARLCGVKVLRFSVGFGRPLWQRRFGPDGTEWAIGAFPLGGYVKMLDEREAPVPAQERHLAFNTQPLRVRAAIVAAGPLAATAARAAPGGARRSSRSRYSGPPAFGPVPDSPSPPKGCTPTTAPTILRLTYRLPARAVPTTRATVSAWRSMNCDSASGCSRS